MWMANGCSKPGAGAMGFNGPLDLRAPEDQFSSSDQVEKRYRRPLSVPELDSTIAAFLHAWSEGDEESTRIAAKELIDGTHAHFQAQGVPAFAHPIVPPQFAQAIADMVRGLPPHFQENALRGVIEAFEGSARAAVEREISRTVAVRRERADERSVARTSDARGSGCGCNAFSGKSDAMNNTVVD